MDSRSDDHLLAESSHSPRTDAGAYPNTIEDPSTGASITFLERGIDEQGAYVVMDGVLPPGTDSGPARFHPQSEVRSEVIAGQAEVTTLGEPHVLLPGESLTIAPGEPHSIRNGGVDTLVVRTTLRPPGEFEVAIRALYEAGAGGKPDVFAVAAVLSHHRSDVRLAGVPWLVQRPLLRLLAGIATMLGRNPLT
ncbi:cupin 2 barrel domain protein [Haloferax gibbonsii]|uniref:Cupin 2 barrel domain protein n=1 Tax=Haloferax gibbonsii TaxID=35746 RepID=A0A871BJ69_HALGI|nr:cupin domain-containing protein [Haloferax gibbonsii]QOS12713.1 cupin 2 barrel domain protein [Haloferax gibbonsii]